MKKLCFLLSLIVYLLMMFENCLATNGDNLIGVTPISRGMGGIGVGMPVGPIDSVFRNPAWMSYYKDFHLSFGGIIFMPHVKGKTNVTPLGPVNPPASETSKANFFVVPEIGLITPLNYKLNFGIGAYGVSGMGVDYRDKDPRLANMHTNFSFMRFIPAISYRINDSISISGAIHIAYGSLDMGATMCSSPTNCWKAGGGTSQDFGLGAQIGLSYNLKNFVFLGLTYQTPVSMNYRDVFDSNGDGEHENLKLTQPQEFALGIGIKPNEKLKLGLDIRWINWENAKGYKDFQWKDQWVIAIGGEYNPIPNLALRAGYNYGRTPIRGGKKDVINLNNIPDFQSQFNDFQIAWFNLLGFPAITENHITLGLGYQFTKNFSIDIAYKYAFNKKVKAVDNIGTGLMVEGQNEQNAVSIGLNWKF